MQERAACLAGKLPRSIHRGPCPSGSLAWSFQGDDRIAVDAALRFSRGRTQTGARSQATTWHALTPAPIPAMKLALSPSALRAPLRPGGWASEVFSFKPAMGFLASQTLSYPHACCRRQDQQKERPQHDSRARSGAGLGQRCGRASANSCCQPRGVGQLALAYTTAPALQGAAFAGCGILARASHSQPPAMRTCTRRLHSPGQNRIPAPRCSWATTSTGPAWPGCARRACRCTTLASGCCSRGRTATT